MIGRIPRSLQPFHNPGLNHVSVWKDDHKIHLLQRTLHRVRKRHQPKRYRPLAEFLSLQYANLDAVKRGHKVSGNFGHSLLGACRSSTVTPRARKLSINFKDAEARSPSFAAASRAKRVIFSSLGVNFIYAVSAFIARLDSQWILCRPENLLPSALLRSAKPLLLRD